MRSIEFRIRNTPESRFQSVEMQLNGRKLKFVLEEGDWQVIKEVLGEVRSLNWEWYLNQLHPYLLQVPGTKGS